MFGFGHLPELIILLTIILLFFGGRRLPEVGTGLGNSITAFRKAAKEDKAEETAVQATSQPQIKAVPSAREAEASTFYSEREASHT